MAVFPECLAHATYRENILHLRSFEFGYSWCMSRLGWIARQWVDVAFDKWLVERLGFGGTNLGPYEALYLSTTSGEAALELHRSLYQEFSGADFPPEKGELWPDREDDPEDLTKPLAAIRERPGLYFTTPSIFALRNFLDGYALALQRAGGRAIRTPDLAGFEVWLSRRELSRGPVVPWERLLCLRRDEAAALERFFLQLDAYHAEQAEPEGGPPPAKQP